MPLLLMLQQEWDAYYEAKAAALTHARPGDIILFGADTNSSMGFCELHASAHTAEHSGALGPFGLPRVNAAGRRLRCFLETNELASLTTFFQKRFYGTWMHPASKGMHQLDHFIISRRDLKRFVVRRCWCLRGSPSEQ